MDWYDSASDNLQKESVLYGHHGECVEREDETRTFVNFT